MPQRIQRKRTKGYRLPAGAIYVGRPTKFGNPWSVGKDGLVEGPGLFFSADPESSRRFTVALYEDWLRHGLACPALMCGRPYVALEEQRAAVLADLGSLAGRDLACWCPESEVCHADLLLALANGRQS